MSLMTTGGRCRHLASAEGQLAACKWLLENDCSPNPVDRFLRTPLEVTCPPACCCSDWSTSQALPFQLMFQILPLEAMREGALT